MNRKILIFIFLVLVSTNVFAYIPRGELKIFAVTSTNQGMDANLIVEIKPGTGKIYSNVNSQVGSLTQDSERNAVTAAERVIPSAKGKYDYFFEIASVATSIDGPSAGAAMALLIVSMLNDNDLSGKVSITGTITADGYIGDVGGIPAKAKKASEVGIKLFMIPIGTRQQAITDENGQSRLVDIIDYAYSNWGLKIVEVETIKDILQYIEMDINEIDINSIPEKKEEMYYPEKIEVAYAILPMRGIVDKYLSDAKTLLAKTEASIGNSTIKDTSIVKGLLSLVDYSKEAIASAEKESEGNYLYTSANETFMAKIYLITVDEVVSNPSITSIDSTIYNLRLQDIENKIALAENRSKLCSLDRLEWCASARQRIVWAKNKINDIKSSSTGNTGTGIDKVMDYSYALAWLGIANDFLDIAITNNGPKFVESEYFKDLAQKYIVDIENEFVLSNPAITSNEDLQRRLKAAKTDYELGWYVTSLYDAASAKAVLMSSKENESEGFDENIFLEKYNQLMELRTSAHMANSENVWSKLFFDHTLYYYKQYQYFKPKNEARADIYIQTANTIASISMELYLVETIVNDYYNNAGVIEVVVPEDGNKIVIEGLDTQENVADQQEQNVYVYKRQDDTRANTIIYVILGGMFLIIIAIVVELERHSNKKQKLQAELLELERKLMDGHISRFTYEEMKKNYLLELKKLEGNEEKHAIVKLDVPKKQVKPKPKQKRKTA